MAGMDSAKLSQRKKQPGHDRSFIQSETQFVNALKAVLPDSYDVVDKPNTLRKLFGKYGIVPEASIRNKTTGRIMYFEVKKQGPGGNADERACRHHTVQFYRTLAKATGMPYHAYATIFCESLATKPVYVEKYPFVIEEGHYFCWVDYDLKDLANYLRRLREKYLE
jgi:hypothetical protein